TRDSTGTGPLNSIPEIRRNTSRHRYDTFQASENPTAPGFAWATRSSSTTTSTRPTGAVGGPNGTAAWPRWCFLDFWNCTTWSPEVSSKSAWTTLTERSPYYSWRPLT